MPDLDHLPVADRLLTVMRDSAGKTLAAKEQFITPRALLLALLDDPEVGPPLRGVVDGSKVEAMEPAGIDLSGVSRLADDRMTGDELPALVRYDTLAFKTPDGADSVWLNKDSLHIFVTGAQRATDTRYGPKHLALGFAAEAVRQPGLLAAILSDPGALVDAIYKL
ncbi:MAG TPA: hypothetical protein VIG51_10380 [Candidatus Baltobacteraceae bacterium]|jgi:hypothetical protein